MYNLNHKMEQYVTQLAVVWFNNLRYDNSLIKTSLAKYMNMDEDEQVFCIKNKNKYKALANTQLEIIDIDFLATGTS